jgi:hypothetical protein
LYTESQHLISIRFNGSPFILNFIYRGGAKTRSLDFFSWRDSIHFAPRPIRCCEVIVSRSASCGKPLCLLSLRFNGSLSREMRAPMDPSPLLALLAKMAGLGNLDRIFYQAINTRPGKR